MDKEFFNEKQCKDIGIFDDSLLDFCFRFYIQNFKTLQKFLQKIKIIICKKLKKCRRLNGHKCIHKVNLKATVLFIITLLTQIIKLVNSNMRRVWMRKSHQICKVNKTTYQFILEYSEFYKKKITYANPTNKVKKIKISVIKGFQNVKIKQSEIQIQPFNSGQIQLRILFDPTTSKQPQTIIQVNDGKTIEELVIHFLLS